MDQFAPYRDKYDLHIENMDTKRVAYDAEMEAALKAFYRHKFGKKKFALVMVSDNNAYDFALAHGEELFPQTPIVFCGVNDFRAETLKGRVLFTGVTESLDIPSTIRVALELLPDTERFFVVNDGTETGQAVTRLARQAFAEYQGRVQVEFASESSGEALREKILQLSAKTVILWGTYLRDSTGQFIAADEVVPRLTHGASVPVFGLVDIFFGKGMVGGNLVSGYYQGETAAKMGLRILNEQQPVSSLPVVTTSANRYMFDYRELERFGLEKKPLPSSSIVINTPVSFYDQNPKLVWSAGGIGLALLGIITSLLGHLIYRRRVEEKLRKSEQTTRAIFNNAFDPFPNTLLTRSSPPITLT